VTGYLDLDDALHVVGRLGFYVRDAGLLSSALARPATTVWGTEAYPDLATKAAALLESLARNHPLIDGNKRLAWALTVLSCWINGFAHDFRADEAFDLVLGVAQGSIEMDAAAAGIRPHLVRR
jgi:death-on-curing protein